MSEKHTPRVCLLRAPDQQAIKEVHFIHQHNRNAVRHTRNLTDHLGLKDMGVHMVRVTQGHDSSEHHSHEEDEEFIYVISGRAQSFIGEDVYDVGPGDFMAFAKNSPAHHFHNPHTEDFIYLVGGTRAPIDICNYPNKGLRQFRIHGVREYTKAKNMQPVVYDKP